MSWIPLIEQMVDEAPAVAGVLTAVLALAHAEADRTEDARRFVGGVRCRRLRSPMDRVWLTGMVCYADAAIECGDPKYAGPLLRPARSLGRSVVATGSGTASGLVSHYLGGLATVLGRYDEADVYFDHSAAMSAPMEAKFFAAMTDLLWGSMLAERQPKATPRRLGTFSPRRTPPQRPTGTGTSSDALRQPSNCWTPDTNEGSPARSVSPHLMSHVLMLTARAAGSVRPDGGSPTNLRPIEITR